MIWNLESWQQPCYNINNGRCVSLFKWKNSKNIIYEETTNNIIPFLSFIRPHSRAFHLSIILLITTFCVKYQSITFNTMKIFYYEDEHKDLNIKYESIYIYTGASISRIIFGFISDRIGIRLTYCIIIILSTLFGILNINYNYIILKLLTGISSAGFVLSELWVMTMFDVNILGLVTGIIGGFGNFGMGLVILINYSIISIFDIELLKYTIYWPYIIYILLIFPIYYMSDDCPYGNFIELKKKYIESLTDNNIEIDIESLTDNNIETDIETYIETDIENNIENNIETDIENVDLDITIRRRGSSQYYTMDNNINLENIISDISYSKKNIYRVFKNIKIFSISLTYLYSFGIEITLIINIQPYLNDIVYIDFKKTVNLLLIFSSINLIARPLGGYLCDKNYEKFKIIGKIKLILLLILITSIMGIIFTYYFINIKNKSYNTILILLIFWSFFNNLLQGTIIGFIPHLDSSNMGVILGIVSSCGTIGGIIGNLLFIYYDIYSLIYINIFGIFIFVLNTFVLL